MKNYLLPGYLLIVDIFLASYLNQTEENLEMQPFCSLFYPYKEIPLFSLLLVLSRFSSGPEKILEFQDESKKLLSEADQ